MARIEAADFHDIAKPGDVRLSPDGEEVAFVRKVPDDDESYESTVHLVPSDGSEEPRQFTVSEGGDSQPRWSPSGDRIAFVSNRGKDDDRPQLWIIPVGGGEGRQVTEVPAGVQGISWSPDGTRIAFTQSTTADEREEGLDVDISEEDEYERETPDPRVIDRTVYRTAQQYFDGARSHVYVAHVGTELAGVDDVEVERVTDGDVDFGGPEWGDASTLYYTAQDVGDDPDDSHRYSIYAYDTNAEEAEKVHETSGWGAGIAANGDGRVAFLYSEEDQMSIQPTELKTVDVASGDVAWISEELDRGLGYEAAPQWGPDGEHVYFSTPDEGKTSVWCAPGDANEAPSRVVRPGAVSAAHVGEDQLAFAMSEWDHPGDVFVCSRQHADQPGLDGGTGVSREGCRRLTELNDDYLDDVEVQEPEELHFNSEQGEVHGWTITPDDFDEDDSYPLAVEVHGGPHAMWTTAGTMWHEFQTLAARGYVVFWSNPRGSTGYGEDYMQAIERDWGDVTLTDVMAGVDLLTERDYVDEDDVHLTGGSFGGFMTSWAVGQTDFFTSAVSQRGVYDLTGFYGSTDGAYSLVEGDFDTTPWEEPEFLWEKSPMGHAHQVDTPTLLIHSDDDYRTPVCTAELWHRILRKQGTDTRFVRYPREGHELSRSGEPGHIVDRIERIARWFDGYSEHQDAERALDREANDGLSAGEEEDGDDESEE
ncbi:acylamino-acid-releasing enzyme [Halolamina pelagica]|uniref:Acylamino-acid-releasing enzyme n=1 Tax=Halolamina pelagica TaxID=699431 RepID=A0A0P7FSX4_9EURY|nr:S9 family peptidase [Halolamina pelagica]KPN29804.1 acylamino-acid-releasing enzyme [Halolamina pelagica]